MEEKAARRSGGAARGSCVGRCPSSPSTPGIKRTYVSRPLRKWRWRCGESSDRCEYTVGYHSSASPVLVYWRFKLSRAVLQQVQGHGSGASSRRVPTPSALCERCCSSALLPLLSTRHTRTRRCAFSVVLSSFCVSLHPTPPFAAFNGRAAEGGRRKTHYAVRASVVLCHGTLDTMADGMRGLCLLLVRSDSAARTTLPCCTLRAVTFSISLPLRASLLSI